MAETMVKVKLKARCMVDKKDREANEIVDLPESIAADFGEVVGGRKQKPRTEEQKGDDE